MKQTFLEQLAEELISDTQRDISSVCLVFPTRRACTIFRHTLGAKLQKPAWAPKIMSISDFFISASGYTIPDDLQLLALLYKVHDKLLPGEDFDAFYPWGQMILKDFDDIDRYLADPDMLFSNLVALKEIDLRFAGDEETQLALQRFWNDLNKKPLSSLKDAFLHTWSRLAEIYHDFDKELRQKNWLYEGAAFREVYNKITSGKFENTFGSEIWFCGLYALSKSEELSISALIKDGNAKIFWDIDSYYYENKEMEAGNLLRSNQLIDPEKTDWIQDHFASEKKVININGISGKIGQAQLLGQELSKIVSQKDFDPRKTAIVLPDESLLLPVLQSLPDEIGQLNITMGYPLKYSSINNLIIALEALQNQGFDDKGNVYHDQFTGILEDQSIQKLDKEFCKSWFKDNELSRTISRKQIDSMPDHIKFILKKVSSTDEVIIWIQGILIILLREIPKEIQAPLLAESAARLSSRLNVLRSLLQENKLEISEKTSWQLIREIISSERIPFSGEPLAGIQIMGFLESRVLDFDKVFILSCNEGVMPMSSSTNSYIPYILRKSFGLPTFEENDAIAAYHFYRLLQRASEVNLTYNTEPGKLGGGEKSRFLFQIQHEMKERSGGNVDINLNTYSVPGHSNSSIPIEIQKSYFVFEKLSRFTDPEKNGYLSPSALSNYISCKLRFYFYSVLGLKEKIKYSSFLNHADFGTVFHDVANELFEMDPPPWKWIDSEMKVKLTDVLDKQLAKQAGFKSGKPAGQAMLDKISLYELLFRRLQKEKSELITDDNTLLSLRMIQLEKEIKQAVEINPKLSVRFGGKIDRIDELAGQRRILDYKTGGGKLPSNINLEKIFSDPEQRYVFQLLFYGMLMLNETPELSYKLGLIQVAKPAADIHFIPDVAIDTEYMKPFTEGMKKMITEIFDKDVPFSQTPDVKRCEWCPYNGICKR